MKAYCWGCPRLPALVFEHLGLITFLKRRQHWESTVPTREPWRDLTLLSGCFPNVTCFLFYPRIHMEFEQRGKPIFLQSPIHSNERHRGVNTSHLVPTVLRGAYSIAGGLL